MLDFLYQSGWGAFSVLLFFQLPFLIVFLFIVYRTSQAGSASGAVDEKSVSRVKSVWITAVIALFLVVNVLSIQFIPAISTAKVLESGQDVEEVDVTAVSWNYEISKREFVTGKPVRFSAKSTDTVHGFAIYHPNGKVLFTMMLVPGVTPSSLIYTFKDPGTYKVRCLEYCGAAHHEMSDELLVKAGKS